MYGREYKGKTINFEASGGLLHSSLVMQDSETDSYWAIMSGEAIAGDFKGTKLKELPIGEKARWQDWVKKYPQTEVLTVNGKEDGPEGYRDYFRNDRGFRGTRASDARLKTKEPIFAFHFRNKNYAVAHRKIENGRVFTVAERTFFFFRRKDASIFSSTTVFESASGFKKTDAGWVHELSGCAFNEDDGKFEGGESCPERFSGFDTFWYNWSLSNPDTHLLE